VASARRQGTRARRPLLAAAAAVAAAVTVAGCVSMPTGGPVLSYPVTQAADGQNQTYVQIVPQPPKAGATPTDIVQGFLTASASFGDYGDIAYDYLTPQEQKNWSDTRYSSALVYKSGPDVAGPATAPSSPKAPASVTVEVSGQTQAFLQDNGSYSVASASAPDAFPQGPQKFTLVKTGRQWRISDAPAWLLLTSDSFQNDYQLRNLYFLAPASDQLVPDPVYVPLQDNSGDLLNGLVRDLISPPPDWLSGNHATRTALPPGTKIRSVTPSGVTAIVNLTGAITKVAGNAEIMKPISQQLLHTLTDPGQSVPNGHTIQSIELEVDGKPWTPPGAQDPVQPVKRATAPGAARQLYSLDSAGYLTSQAAVPGQPVRGLHIGSSASTSVAVSTDTRYLAVLHAGTLSAGLIDGPLAKLGTGFQAVSWDANDDLWASHGDQIVLFRGTSKKALSQRVDVTVSGSGATVDGSGPFTALRVAPDGVRVAIVVGGSLLQIGAISGRDGQNPMITFSQVQLKPLNDATTFTGLTWYGEDYVITLAQPGPVATEYPVSGGSPASVSVEPGMTSITAAYGKQLIAGLPKGRLASLANLSSAWTTAGSGYAPVYPG
jgi:Lipoprotein LpqB beta-propeller domain/Sporulation and spore germination